MILSCVVADISCSKRYRGTHAERRRPINDHSGYIVGIHSSMPNPWDNAHTEACKERSCTRRGIAAFFVGQTRLRRIARLVPLVIGDEVGQPEPTAIRELEKSDRYALDRINPRSRVAQHLPRGFDRLGFVR